MIERADQLVLNFVSQAADAAHGVLRADQRLDFARRLRARIEDERGGSQNAREVAKVLARFGDPAALVEQEARRLAGEGVATRRDTFPAAANPPGGAGSTRRFPSVVDDSAVNDSAVDDQDAPPGVRAYREVARERLGGRARGGREMPFAGLRRAAMSSANPMATGGRDARTILKEHPRDAAAMAILVVAALLVPFGLAPLAIFPVPVVVWALGAATVLLSEVWKVRDKLVGVGAPLLGYSVGGVLVGGLRVGTEAGAQAFVTQFFDVSGTMFMIGTGLGVVWLAYRLLDVT
ncbi:hypothetical protein ACFQYP_57995 [Nonomuraea antimicrobica]|uniref:hypothetical protein n=1 Tax=Nonomuraea antimicrobica TaxID=561173 RepID=UPI0031EF178A